MIVGDDKLLSAKMIVMALLSLKVGLNGLALYNSKFHPEFVLSQLSKHSGFIYQSLQNYTLFFCVDTLIIIIGVVGYFLFYNYRWYILAPCLFLSIGLGLLLGGRFSDFI